MSKEKVDTEETKKTAILLAIENLLLAPLYYFSPKAGFTASVALTGATLWQLHELGKDKRSVENLLNQAGSFFSSKADASSADIDNAVSNIVKGGATIYDGFVPK
ncbi:hypothetical protein [Legionella fallonii]|uniref:Uncharacterized protein n=1 Tax=Legionella fallonii LLAP-10 TaxID=1212491 RepID=A0A098GA33_9GAMM|nr:hypothetical protein [Legionella fallonii]CEG58870.1 conserved protein of unknown function [Legionella fallonii LLAP-10]